MPSDLGHALLGLLARRPSTGYELARRMQRPVGWFWTAGHSQVYPELARLEAAGLVRHDVVPGRGPRATKRYAPTAAGTAALRQWVTAELAPQPVRDLEVLRLWSVWLVDPEAASDLVHRVRDGHAQRLAAYEADLATLDGVAAAHDPSAPEFASRLTLEGGLRTRRAAVEWCDWMLAELARAAPG
ncbi:PadR family transcriptional regulator [Phycicoccus sonneratiae]|uniref:PadR family transcriptional regulator n=1 Tax=Phycicoccus sonneratiae TaxID=2807628 RepID=A0ABS2CQF0_9MICO|nr:PadR family transcriptional regulator [Phycicoccus sonneraticus]MBM6402104.1 PadR family transcriptional regulator [Phycicoccus sonneraticus]